MFRCSKGLGSAPTGCRGRDALIMMRNVSISGRLHLLDGSGAVWGLIRGGDNLSHWLMCLAKISQFKLNHCNNNIHRLTKWKINLHSQTVFMQINRILNATMGNNGGRTRSFFDKKWGHTICPFIIIFLLTDVPIFIHTSVAYYEIKLW